MTSLEQGFSTFPAAFVRWSSAGRVGTLDASLTRTLMP